MSYSNQEAWANRCYELIGKDIAEYSQGYAIPQAWVAGLISVECARLDPKASRFEQGVYNSVCTVKTGHKSTSFPGFNSGPIKDFIVNNFGEPSLKSLATSYGFGQIMGYHYVNKWGLKPDQYMNLSNKESVKYTMLFMQSGHFYAKQGYPNNEFSNEVFERLLRWHNTGSCTGKTYSDKYVPNAMLMVNAYKLLLETKKIEPIKTLNPNLVISTSNTPRLDSLEKRVAILEDLVDKLEKHING